MEEFNYNANQYVDFCEEVDDQHGDSFFENMGENTAGFAPLDEAPLNGVAEGGSDNAGPAEGRPRTSTVYEDAQERNLHQEHSDTESDIFFSPVGTAVSNSTVYLKGQLRRSLSVGNLKLDGAVEQEAKNDAMDDLLMRPSSANEGPRPSSANEMRAKGPSQECINRLAQPKRFTSNENLTLAEAVAKFQISTPRRFRSKPSPKFNKRVPMSWGGTKPNSPNLKTMARSRPTTAISKDDQERLEMEEAKKFKIKAHPVNKKVLRGPLKPQVDKKPPTNPEPFHLTEFKKKPLPVESKPSPFRAQPLPKSLHQPYKVQPSHPPPTKAQSPNFIKKAPKITPNKVETQKTPQQYKPTSTLPRPFSFDKRDQELLKRKEEHINKILEEERKAREFHARPPPKAILRSRNSSQDRTSVAGSSKSLTRSTDELDTTVFRARPATVLTMKPFEPHSDENHVIKVEPFRFSTDQRVEARHKFQEKVKEKEAIMEEVRKQKEELAKRMEEEEVARMRKQMEYKAQPIKKYKEIHIEPTNKVTIPISPKFYTDRIRNKENIQK